MHFQRRFSLIIFSLLATLQLGAASDDLIHFDFQSDPMKSLPAPANSNYAISFSYGPNFESAGADAGWSRSQGTLFARAVQLSGEPILALGKSSKNTPEDEIQVVQTASFVEFSIAPLGNNALELDKLKARIGSQRLEKDNERIESFTTQYFIRCSLDDYQTTLGIGRIFLGSAQTASSVEWTTIETDLSAYQAFNNLTQPVHFRIYIYMTTSKPSSLQVARVDDIIIQGSAR